MEKSKKIKIYVGLFYLILFLCFLIIFFSKYSFEEIKSYEFIQQNRDYFLNLKEANFIFVFLLLLLCLRPFVWLFRSIVIIVYHYFLFDLCSLFPA